jgi:hypothetical protein
MTTEITKANMSEFVVTGEFDIAGSIKPEAGSSEQKEFTLRFVMSKTPIADIIHSSLKDKKINWQVKGRDKFAAVVNKSVIRVDYKGGRAPVDTKQSYREMLAGMTPEQRAAEIESLKAMK